MKSSVRGRVKTWAGSFWAIDASGMATTSYWCRCCCKYKYSRSRSLSVFFSWPSSPMFLYLLFFTLPLSLYIYTFSVFFYSPAALCWRDPPVTSRTIVASPIGAAAKGNLITSVAVLEDWTLVSFSFQSYNITCSRQKQWMQQQQHPHSRRRERKDGNKKYIYIYKRTKQMTNVDDCRSKKTMLKMMIMMEKRKWRRRREQKKNE